MKSNIQKILIFSMKEMFIGEKTIYAEILVFGLVRKLMRS
jgi:hypothetical protein